MWSSKLLLYINNNYKKPKNIEFIDDIYNISNVFQDITFEELSLEILNCYGEKVINLINTIDRFTYKNLRPYRNERVNIEIIFVNPLLWIRKVYRDNELYI